MRALRSMLLPSALLLTALSWSPDASAKWPDDVQLSALSSFEGQPVTSLATSRAAYEQVVRELGAIIANKPTTVAHTTGLEGFDVSLTNTVGFIQANGERADATGPAAWERLHGDNDPSHTLWIPRLNVRKGLPLSSEVGANLGYVAFSGQTVFGAYGRIGLVEGYRQFPNVAIQGGYTAYLGNPELDLGVMDMSATIGYSIPFGRFAGVNDAVFSPFFGVGWIQINAVPTLDTELQQEIGVRAVSGFKSKDHYVDGFRPATLSLGGRVLSGDVQMSLAGTLTTTKDRATPTIEVGLGYVF
jgi:hypothetical protein